MAYNTKLYRSTGSAWEEVRVGSEWGMIANKPTNFPPTSHTHPDYLSVAGGTLSGSLSITTTNYPVLDIVRNTGSKGSGVYGGARLRRVTSKPQAGVGIGFYFSAPNASGAEKIAGLFGACLTNIASGAEVGQLKFTPAWHGDDPYDNTVMTLTATGLNQGRLELNGDLEATGSIKINGNNVLTGVTNYLNVNGETVGFYSATSQTTKAVYAATSQLSTSTAKRYLIGTQATTSLAVQNCNANVYMQNGKIYSSPTSDSDPDNTVATKGYVDNAKAKDSDKLGGRLPSYYAPKSDVPVITYSNGTLTITTG